jgi:hypothetical protein
MATANQETSEQDTSNPDKYARMGYPVSASENERTINGDITTARFALPDYSEGDASIHCD